MNETYDDLNPTQRDAVEQLVAEANARHQARCAKLKTRDKITQSHTVLADDLRQAYVEGKKAKEEAQ